MYGVNDDPFSYKNTSILKNRLGIRTQDELDDFEAEATAQRFSEPLPVGRCSVSHYCAIHRHIFGDVYRWAGRYRTVRIAKGGSMFAYPDYIAGSMRDLFRRLQDANRLQGLSAETYAPRAAGFLANLNAIHPFRDGNGRTQLAFMAILSEEAGHPLNLERLEPEPFLQAMIASFRGDEAPLAGQLLDMTL